MKTRSAFTMIELIFVIVVMGIIGKFGVEFLAQAYKSFIFSNVNNTLHSKSASAVEFIASRLQYRIKDSLIMRQGTGGAVTGVGFSFNNYELVNNVTLEVDADGNLTHTLSAIYYDKNRFKTFNLNVPLIIEFQIPVNKKDKRMFIGAGVIGTMNLSGKMKTVYTDGNSTIKYKDKSSNWPLSQFSYQATARVGYDAWYIFANYAMMPLFDQTKPVVYPSEITLAAIIEPPVHLT